MKMYIPEIGDEIILTSDWEFKEFNNFTNHVLINGTILKVKRIYIRQSMPERSTISFKVIKTEGFIFLNYRKIKNICVSLDYVNKIKFEIYKLNEKIQKIELDIIKYVEDEIIKFSSEYNRFKMLLNTYQYVLPVKYDNSVVNPIYSM